MAVRKRFIARVTHLTNGLAMVGEPWPGNPPASFQVEAPHPYVTQLMALLRLIKVWDGTRTIRHSTSHVLIMMVTEWGAMMEDVTVHNECICNVNTIMDKTARVFYIQTLTVPSTPPDISLPLHTTKDQMPASSVSNHLWSAQSSLLSRPERHTEILLPAPAETMRPSRQQSEYCTPRFKNDWWSWEEKGCYGDISHLYAIP